MNNFHKNIHLCGIIFILRKKESLPQRVSFLFSYVVRLALLDSTGGAGINAAAAVNAGVSVDDILGVALGDSADGAAISTSAAAQASVSNHIGHGKYTSVILCRFLYPAFEVIIAQL